MTETGGQPPSPYQGSTWRSRFLRAPKAALQLAARKDFVPLSELAVIQLGLKSGADAFFFLKVAEESNRSAETMYRGLNGVWTGAISRSDLLPAALNPHELFASGGRRLLRVPRETKSFYLSPRPGPLKKDLSGYIEAAEREGVNQRKLVRQNASPSRWFVQARGIIKSPWLLPYNSGYDYGAWENPYQAVLNGRFLGATPRSGIDPSVLGAILNSTFAIIGRLIVGTTTGTEGAFDVGPPAARRLLVPDLRQASEKNLARIVGIFDEWRKQDTMFPAPSRSAHVDALRHELDLSILEAIGETKGSASAIVGSVYESYARWRSSVENVETIMRANRREMNRNRTGRSISPIELAAQRVWEEVMVDFPPLPASLLLEEDACELLEVDKSLDFASRQPNLLPGLVALSDGSYTDLGSFERARYAAMLLAIGFEPPIAVLASHLKSGAIVERFEQSGQELLTEAARRAQAYVKDEDSRRAVVELVHRKWLRACRQAGTAPPLRDS